MATILLGIGMFWLALRKAPSERTSLNGTAAKAYAEAAKIAGERLQEAEDRYDKASEKIDELEARLACLERKKFRVTVNFTLGDPPEVGQVILEPVCEEELAGE